MAYIIPNAAADVAGTMISGMKNIPSPTTTAADATPSPIPKSFKMVNRGVLLSDVLGCYMGSTIGKAVP